MNTTNTSGIRGSRFTIRSRLTAAFGVVLALFIASTGGAVWFASQLDSARHNTQHSFEVLVAVGHLRTGMRAQESGLRGYVITANPNFKNSYIAGKADFTKALNQLRRLTRDNPAQQDRLARIAELEDRWQDQIAQKELDLIRQQNMQQAQALITAGSGEQLLDTLRDELQQLSLGEYQLLAEREGNFAQLRKLAMLVVLTLLGSGLIIGLLAIISITRQISAPLTRLTGDMRRIAEGEYDLAVPYRSRNNEVGEIARALEHFRRISIESETSSWVHTNLVKLRLAAQRAKTEKDLARELLDRLAPMLGARYAALFIRDAANKQFQLLAGYGYGTNARYTRTFSDDEGLVGQCARDQQPLVLDDVPAGYINVASGLGQAKPNRLILAPAVYAEQTLAVLELALFEKYSERHEALLEQILPTTALSLATLKQHRQTQALLEETTAQSEELRASEEELRNQQEELRQTNEELRLQSDELTEQSGKLRASEEELRAQTERLESTNKELRQKGELLEQQNTEIERARDDLESKAEALAQASQYKSEFLANMSHELRTPLNSLLILARSLADNDQGHLDAEEVEAASIVHDSGSNLLQLINDILDLSKVEAGKMQVHMQALALAGLRDRLQRNFAHVAQEKGLEYEVTLAEDAPQTITTDAGKLEQILNNLLGNAFKFTKQGRVSVTIARPAPEMELRTPGLTARNSVCLTVSDAGIGIPEDKRDRIFQAFEQVDSSTSRVYGGTGLGLSISQRLAQLLGGEIHLDSVQGQGSNFSVVVPEHGRAEETAADARLQALPEPAPVSGSPRAAVTPRPVAVEDDRADLSPEKRCILVIEDDARFAKVLRDDTRRKGFQCLLAADGESGVALAREYRPTGILLDIGLPDIDGWAVLERLKALPETRSIPVHILSAADDTGWAIKHGAVGYVSKPVRREGLEAVFKRVLEAAGGERKRLLVVDDDKVARKAVQTLFKHEDIDIHYAADGEAALAALTQTPADCVVLDLNLPDISGFELIERIKALDPSLPVVVYSARQLSDDENMRLREHTDSIVVKGQHSQTRLLDEVNLFLHSIGAQSRLAELPQRTLDKDLSGKTVLLVDDDMRNTFALSRVLRAKGLKVLMAQDGLKALEQLERHPDVDIVLMDIMMPGIDGYETMRRIRAQAHFGKLPILALTAKAMRGDREKCIEAGANDYLSKPIDTGKLLSMMRAWS